MRKVLVSAVVTVASLGAFFLLTANSYAAVYQASYVLGQSDFVSSGANTTQATLNYPQDMAYDSVNHRLFVVDSSNSRVVVFDVATTTIQNGENASYVLGQTDFVSSNTATTQDGMNNPISVAYDAVNDRLFVADTYNNRVLVFNVAPGTIQNGENASYVLGQTDFTSATATVSQSGMNQPSGLAFDPTNDRLFVGDLYNSRVLVFDVAPGTIQNGENASYVLGQTDFTSLAAATSQSGLNQPAYLAFDPAGNELFVADVGGRRLIRFNVAPGTITNGESANFVIGEPDFTTVDGTVVVSATSSILSNGLVYDPAAQRLFASDFNANRVVVYQFVSMEPAVLSDATVNEAYTAPLSATSSQGTVSLSLVSGSLPNGVNLSDTGLSGTPTAAGNYSFAVAATDNNGAIGSVTSQPLSLSLVVAGAPMPAPVVSTGGGVALPVFNYNISVTPDSTTTAVINWSTSLPSASYVIYGPTAAYGQTAQPEKQDDNIHYSARLIGLQAGTTYHYSIISTAMGRTTTSTDATFGGPAASVPNSATAVTATAITASSSVTALEAEIASLTAQVEALANKAGASSPIAAFSNPQFTADLALGDRGTEVAALQRYLDTHGFPLARSGSGSSGQETEMFGALTRAALIRFQAANGLPATGYFGPLTRKLISASAQ